MPYLYQGKYETNLTVAIQMDARWYQPKLGRWLQPDYYSFAQLSLPKGARQQLLASTSLNTQGLLKDPAQQLRYGYVSGNPLRWIDLYGLSSTLAQGNIEHFDSWTNIETNGELPENYPQIVAGMGVFMIPGAQAIGSALIGTAIYEELKGESMGATVSQAIFGNGNVQAEAGTLLEATKGITANSIDLLAGGGAGKIASATVDGFFNLDGIADSAKELLNEYNMRHPFDNGQMCVYRVD